VCCTRQGELNTSAPCPTSHVRARASTHDANTTAVRQAWQQKGNASEEHKRVMLDECMLHCTQTAWCCCCWHIALIRIQSAHESSRKPGHSTYLQGIHTRRSRRPALGGTAETQQAERQGPKEGAVSIALSHAHTHAWHGWVWRLAGKVAVWKQPLRPSSVCSLTLL
jgi:hypothetical protein